MKKALIYLALIIGISACCASRKVPTQTNTETHIHIVDSIAWHDSTVYHNIYKEYYNDYTSLLDTLNLETSYSEFKSYIDTSARLLKGEAKNKEIDIPVQIKWKEKIVYKDSIQTKEIPVPVEVTKEITKYPKSYWWFMGFTLLTGIYFALKVYLKLKFGKNI